SGRSWHASTGPTSGSTWSPSGLLQTSMRDLSENCSLLRNKSDGFLSFVFFWGGGRLKKKAS
ncbi:unnamed protein product, partial [Heterosigma akashiwo]